MQPKREILSMMDMPKWKKSKGFNEYFNFINNLNEAVKGSSLIEEVLISENCQKILDMITKLSEMVDEVPPIQQPQRFGNKAFKTWLTQVKENSNSLLKSFVNDDSQIEEVAAYLNESFGNDTRIDYGTDLFWILNLIEKGHEMTFMMFLMCLYKIDVLKQEDSKAVINRVFNQYLILVRKLQVVYNMEPAGSHGVWSLDDFQFLPFIFGSSQLVGSKIEPQNFVEVSFIEKYKDQNMFFSCLKYIITMKTGPFAEHSNQLWNVSMVPTWTKINSGLIKMYTVEVLEKFPVVQHILFGQHISISSI